MSLCGARHRDLLARCLHHVPLNGKQHFCLTLQQANQIAITGHVFIAVNCSALLSGHTPEGDVILNVY